jgi:lipopolysaccharide/colanic/teichoic acid biosynthesis glycosyltransferase
MQKFRSMRLQADPYGRSPESGDDPRLTRVGKFLRETSLDELPQLFNVLAGEMSVVGPRPLYERQAAQWTPRQRGRLDVRPGLTGWAQVMGRGDLPIEDKIELDLWYVEHQSMALNLKILARTALDALRRRGGIYEKQYSHDHQREIIQT